MGQAQVKPPLPLDTQAYPVAQVPPVAPQVQVRGEPPQVSLVGQVEPNPPHMHVPPWQVSLVGQAAAQDPQLAASASRSLQVPLQQVVPGQSAEVRQATQVPALEQ